MKLIKRTTLLEYGKRFPKAKKYLESWYFEVKNANWINANEIKEKYAHASIIGNNRIVFNIQGNKHRLIAEINYKQQFVFIRFLGTHKEYDKVNAEVVSDY